jgi:PAS domain S-box-containing protein
MRCGDTESQNSIEVGSWEQLKRSEARLRSMVQNSSDIIALIDADGRILYISPSVQLMTGYSPEQITGRNALSFVHSEDYARMHEALMRIVIEGQGDTQSYRFRCADGSWRWLETTGVNLMSNPDVGAIVIDSRDVTELKQTQNAVEEILESTMDAVFSLDRSWRFTYVNSHAAQAFRSSREALLGQCIWDVEPKAIDSEFYYEYHRAMLEQVPVAFEAYSTTRDAWYEVRAYPTRSGISVYFRDVSERKRTETALQQSELHFRSLISNAAVVIWALDRDGIITLSEGKLLDSLGIKAGAHVGRSIWELYAGNPLVLEDARRALAGEEVQSERGFGDNMTLGIRYQPVFDADGAVSGAIGVATDITARKRAEQILIEHAMSNALRIDVGNALMRSNNLQQMLQHCAHAMLNHFSVAAVRIWVMEDDGRTLRMQASDGLLTDIHDDYARIAVGEYKVGHIASRREAQVSNDLQHDAAFPAREWAQREGVEAFAGYPLLVNEQLVGVMALFARHPLDEQILKMLSLIATSIALGVERQQALLKLRHGEERYRSLVSAASQIVWSAGADGQAHDMSGWRAFTGQSEQTVQGDGWLEAIHPHDRAMARQAWQHAVQTQTVYHVEYRLHKHDGTYEYFLSRGVPVFESDGRVREWVGMSTNIHYRKRTEQDLQNVLTNVECILWHANVERQGDDFNWEVSIVNEEAVKRLLQIPSGESAGLFCTSRLPEEEERVNHNSRTALLSGEAGYSQEYRCRAADGHVVWLHEEARIEPLAPDQWHIVGVCTDITARKRAETEVAAFTTRLEQSNRELREFAYVASHDLQEPLRKIQMFSDLLQQHVGANLEEEAREYLQRMQNAAARMQNLIQSILSLSRVSTAGQDFTPINLEQIAHEVLGDLEVLLRQTGATVEIGDLCVIEADPSQMRQLLQNLIGNAVKFHRPEAPPRVEVCSRLSDDGEMCHITVRDNGIGFDEAFAERIFLPFRRLHGPSQYAGTGMGLSICRRIAERHSGTITAQSTSGEGATFTITLPLHQKPAQNGD